MIRNAVDHGLETPGEARRGRQAGRGHRAPDGRRTAPAASSSRSPTTAPASTATRQGRQKAIDKGLIAADADLTDEEIDNLIFLPGFSTAEQVSDISGRGVGMDVVKRSIQALGGRIIDHLAARATARPSR